MACGRMEFHARSIMRHTDFSFVLPNDTEMEEVRNTKHYDRDPINVILLHGLTGTDTDWLYGGNARWMSIQYNLNIFMPSTGNSFYLDKGYEGANCATFIAEELPEYIGKTFGINMERENTMIGGLSMGGYGTLRTALAYPDRFFSCLALSSAIHIRAIADDLRDHKDKVTPYEMTRDIFGDPDELLTSDKNPEVLYSRIKQAGGKAPKIYFACGTEDDLVGANRMFRDFLEKEGADYIYEEGPGRHDWVFWTEYLDRGLAALLPTE